MEFAYSNDCFLPYDSFDYIFAERELPEFGLVKSPYTRQLDTWRFFFAKSENDLPIGFDSTNYDDSEWDLINVPSTWQTEGYSLPQNLLYDFPSVLDSDRERREGSISNKYYMNSTTSEEDRIGIYRTEVVFTERELDRAIYLEVSGIAGSFDVYVNGKHVCFSHSIYTNKKLLISNEAKLGINCITISVNEFDRDSSGRIVKELANFGFSGIFRPISITFESLLEMSNVHIKCKSIPNTYVNQLELDESGSERKTISKISRGDYMIFMDIKITNHTDYMMPFSIRTSILEARGEYDPYKLPFVKLNIEKTMEGVCDSNKDITVSSQMIACNVVQWSDYTPIQYDVVFELLDSEGRVICTKKRRFGFRTSEVILDKININERRIPLLLTRYYEFDPQSGIAIGINRMRQDIVLMKRCGINGIIVQAFPANDMLLNLCDQYGIYVFALSGRNQMLDYVQTHMVHPSIISWGLIDYRFDYNKSKSIKDKCLEIDDLRCWYCECDTTSQITDLGTFPNEAGKVFGPWQDICLDRKAIFDKNKTDKNIFETISGRMHFPEDEADFKWIHQSDLEGDKTREASSIGQGIVDSERNPHPIYFDIKKQCEMITVFPEPSKPTNLTMRNMHPFAYSDEMILEWRLLLGGNVLTYGNGRVREIEPYGTRTLKFNVDVEKYLNDGWAMGNTSLIELYNEALSHELIFDISLRQANDNFYSKEGHEVTFFQEVLAESVASPVNTGTVRKSLNAFNVDRLLDDSGLPVLPTVAEDDCTEASTDCVAELNENMVDSKEEITNVSSTDSLIDSSKEIQGDLVPVDESIIESEGEISVDMIMNAERRAEDSNQIFALPQGIVIGRDSIQFAFDRKTGSVNHIKIGDYEFLKGGFIPSFYRCPTNIDRTDKSFILSKTIFSKENDYEGIQESLEFVGCEYGMQDDTFTLLSRYKSFAMKGEILMLYEISNDCKLRITLSFTPKYDMVRYGVRVPISSDNLFCKWYGRGPGESYYDRKNATRLGLYRAKADEIYHPYARPSENSSHTDTSCVVLENMNNDAVRIVQSEEKKFDFTVLPYSPEQMNEFLHQEQLMQNDYCELFLDFCSKEIERTKSNVSVLPLKRNISYKGTFEFTIIPSR